MDDPSLEPGRRSDRGTEPSDERAGSAIRTRARAAAAGGRSWLTRRRLTILGTALFILIGVPLALRTVDLGAVVDDVSSADPALLALALAVYTLSWPIRGRRYGDVLDAMGHRQGTTFLTAVVWCSQTANLIVPARAGDAVRAVALSSRRDVPYSTGFASLAVERLFDLLAIAALAFVATAWVALAGDGSRLALVGETDDLRRAAVAAGGVSALAGIVAASVVVAAHATRGLENVLRGRFSAHPRLRDALATVVRFAGDVAVVARDRRAILVVGAGSLVVWTLDVLTAVVVLAALDGGLALGPLLAVGTLAVSVGNLAKVLPLTQGGIGLYEVAFTALVVGLSPIGASTALAAAVVDHALKNAVTLVGGAGSALLLGLSPLGPPEATDDGREPTDRQAF